MEFDIYLNFKRPNFLSDFTEGQSFFYVYFVLFTSGYAWLCLILSSVTSILPDLVYKIYENYSKKRKIDNFMNIYLKNS